MTSPARVAQQVQSPLSRMIAAVAIETATVRRKSIADFIDVTDGVRVTAAGGGATYNFSCTRIPFPQDDDRVIGDFDGERAHGFVVASGTGNITVVLEKDFGPSITEGRLLIDRTFLWTSLRDRLVQLRQAPGPLNLHNVHVLTGAAAPRVIGRASLSPMAVGPALNKEQTLLYEQALGSDVTFGWGPPGTGKTMVCERIIADGFYPQELHTLLAAPTNKAVDLALGRVLARLEQTGMLASALASGHIVRVGPLRDPHLDQLYGHAISLDALVAAEREAILARREKLAADEVAATMEFEEVTRRPSQPDAPLITDAVLMERRLAINELREQIQRLDHRLGSVRHDVLARARIVATTVHRVYMADQVERMFDAVVLDEAGFTNLPAACCAAAHARKNLVVLGDFRQLGAIAASHRWLVRQWVECDVFYAANVVDALERGREVPSLVVLRVQHRSHPDIAGLLNAVTYTHMPLVTHASVLARAPLGSPWGTNALMLVDTSALRPFVQTGPRGFSRSNAVHAAVVRWLVNEIDRYGGIPAQPGDPDGVVVLSPFREQLKLLRRHTPQSLVARAFELSTVHRYQGDERGTVILDLVDTRGLRALSGFMRAMHLSDSGSRLVNVAASRARNRFILVADVRYLLRNMPRGPVRAFVDHMSCRATRITVPLPHAVKALSYVHRQHTLQRGP